MELRRLRRQRVLSMEDLAQKAGVARSTVYLIESGKKKPRFVVIRKLSKALGIDPLEVDEFKAVIEES